MSNVLDALIGRVHDSDPGLANALMAEIKKLQNRREYGLVYEPHALEGVRLWGKKILTGDVVNVLPPRGVMEKAENKIEWKVLSIKNKVAHIARKDDEGNIVEQDVPVEDLVAYADFRQTIYPGLVEVDRVERGSKDDPYHVVINGENFHALQAMLWCYAGKVDCIYIDPPYNTGAKDWKYNNDYVDGNDQYKHSKWLSFMEQRLKLAKKLLNPKDSVLIVTIDEKEYLRLGMLLEQMFPEANIQMISSVINPKGTARVNEFSRVNEFIYFVMIGTYNLNRTGSDMLAQDVSKNIHVRWRGFPRTGRKGLRSVNPGSWYPIYFNIVDDSFNSVGESVLEGENIPESPEGTYAVWPPVRNGEEYSWAMVPSTFKKLYELGAIKFGKPVKGKGASISYLTNNQLNQIKDGTIIVTGRDDNGSLEVIYVSDSKTTAPKTQWNLTSHEAGAYGTNIVGLFVPGRRFPFPKSVYAVEDALRFFVGNANKKNALIIDFFAGSGTTAHATMLLNHLDGGKRRCISITNNEIGPDTEKEFVTKKRLRPTDVEWQKYGIAKYITWERVKAALTGINTKGEPIKGDYKFTEEFPMSEGFKENAIFFDLKYEDGKAIRLNMAFKEIAPLLWMKAGSKGRIIQVISPKGYDVSEQYAILFDYMAVNQFIREIKDSGIKIAYIVTDSESLYQQVYRQLPKGVEPVRLYENYLTSFAIYGSA